MTEISLKELKRVLRFKMDEEIEIVKKLQMYIFEYIRDNDVEYPHIMTAVGNVLVICGKTYDNDKELLMETLSKKWDDLSKIIDYQ